MFDSTVNDFGSHDSDQVEIYRKRRENACAFWASIPDKDFDIRHWKSSTLCGTVCCAIGWLAEKEHDGWHWSASWASLWPRNNTITNEPGDSRSITSAARHSNIMQGIADYFGLSISKAYLCFTKSLMFDGTKIGESNSEAQELINKVNEKGSHESLKGISDLLMSMPYVMEKAHV